MVLDAAHVVTLFDKDVSLDAPPGAPRVADNPIVRFVRGTIADDYHAVVYARLRADGARIDARSMAIKRVKIIRYKQE